MFLYLPQIPSQVDQDLLRALWMVPDGCFPDAIRLLFQSALSRKRSSQRFAWQDARSLHVSMQSHKINSVAFSPKTNYTDRPPLADNIMTNFSA
jgi:hypothetical protein